MCNVLTSPASVHTTATPATRPQHRQVSARAQTRFVPGWLNPASRLWNPERWACDVFPAVGDEPIFTSFGRTAADALRNAKREYLRREREGETLETEAQPAGEQVTAERFNLG